MRPPPSPSLVALMVGVACSRCQCWRTLPALPRVALHFSDASSMFSKLLNAGCIRCLAFVAGSLESGAPF